MITSERLMLCQKCIETVFTSMKTCLCGQYQNCSTKFYPATRERQSVAIPSLIPVRVDNPENCRSDENKSTLAVTDGQRVIRLTYSDILYPVLWDGDSKDNDISYMNSTGITGDNAISLDNNACQSSPRTNVTQRVSMCVDNEYSKTHKHKFHSNYFSQISRRFLRQQLSSREFWHAFKIVKSKPDGHCLVSSMSTSLRLQHGEIMNNDSLLNKIISETTENIRLYRAFQSPTQASSLQAQLNDYMERKIYNTCFGDCVPLIIANMLHINIILIENIGLMYSPKIITGSGNTHRYVYIYKRGEHYDGLSLTDDVFVRCDNENNIGDAPCDNVKNVFLKTGILVVMLLVLLRKMIHTMQLCSPKIIMILNHI